MVKLLLDRGAEPNAADQLGATPLHYAAVEGHKAVVQLLMSRGADPNLADHGGKIPQHTGLFRQSDTRVELNMI